MGNSPSTSRRRPGAPAKAEAGSSGQGFDRKAGAMGIIATKLWHEKECTLSLESLLSKLHSCSATYLREDIPTIEALRELIERYSGDGNGIALTQDPVTGAATATALARDKFGKNTIDPRRPRQQAAAARPQTAPATQGRRDRRERSLDKEACSKKLEKFNILLETRVKQCLLHSSCLREILRECSLEEGSEMQKHLTKVSDLHESLLILLKDKQYEVALNRAGQDSQSQIERRSDDLVALLYRNWENQNGLGQPLPGHTRGTPSSASHASARSQGSQPDDGAFYHSSPMVESPLADSATAARAGEDEQVAAEKGDADEAPNATGEGTEGRPRRTQNGAEEEVDDASAASHRSRDTQARSPGSQQSHFDDDFSVGSNNMDWSPMRPDSSQWRPVGKSEDTTRTTEEDNTDGTQDASTEEDDASRHSGERPRADNPDGEEADEDNPDGTQDASTEGDDSPRHNEERPRADNPDEGETEEEEEEEEEEGDVVGGDVTKRQSRRLQQKRSEEEPATEEGPTETAKPAAGGARLRRKRSNKKGATKGDAETRQPRATSGSNDNDDDDATDPDPRERQAAKAVADEDTEDEMEVPHATAKKSGDDSANDYEQSVAIESEERHLTFDPAQYQDLAKRFNEHSREGKLMAAETNLLRPVQRLVSFGFAKAENLPVLLESPADLACVLSELMSANKLLGARLELKAQKKKSDAAVHLSVPDLSAETTCGAILSKVSTSKQNVVVRDEPSSITDDIVKLKEAYYHLIHGDQSFVDDYDKAVRIKELGAFISLGDPTKNTLGHVFNLFNFHNGPGTLAVHVVLGGLANSNLLIEEAQALALKANPAVPFTETTTIVEFILSFVRPAQDEMDEEGDLWKEAAVMTVKIFGCLTQLKKKARRDPILQSFKKGDETRPDGTRGEGICYSSDHKKHKMQRVVIARTALVFHLRPAIMKRLPPKFFDGRGYTRTFLRLSYSDIRDETGFLTTGFFDGTDDIDIERIRNKIISKGASSDADDTGKRSIILTSREQVESLARLVERAAGTQSGA